MRGRCGRRRPGGPGPVPASARSRRRTRQQLAGVVGGADLHGAAGAGGAVHEAGGRQGAQQVADGGTGQPQPVREAAGALRALSGQHPQQLHLRLGQVRQRGEVPTAGAARCAAGGPCSGPSRRAVPLRTWQRTWGRSRAHPARPGCPSEFCLQNRRHDDHRLPRDTTTSSTPSRRRTSRASWATASSTRTPTAGSTRCTSRTPRPSTTASTPGWSGAAGSRTRPSTSSQLDEDGFRSPGTSPPARPSWWSHCRSAAACRHDLLPAVGRGGRFQDGPVPERPPRPHARLPRRRTDVPHPCRARVRPHHPLRARR